MRMLDSATAAELAHDDIPRQTAFDAWYVERLRQLRNEPGELVSALSDEEMIEVGVEFFRMGMKAPHEDLDAWRKRKLAQWSTLWHGMVERVMRREEKDWRP